PFAGIGSCPAYINDPASEMSSASTVVARGQSIEVVNRHGRNQKLTAFIDPASQCNDRNRNRRMEREGTVQCGVSEGCLVEEGRDLPLSWDRRLCLSERARRS